MSNVLFFACASEYTVENKNSKSGRETKSNEVIFGIIPHRQGRTNQKLAVGPSSLVPDAGSDAQRDSPTRRAREAAMGKPRLGLDAKLTAAELKRIAFLCGWKHSGTKALLSQDLLARAAAWKPLPAGARVLSIDLGIKNLAYSLVTTPPRQMERGMEDPARGRRRPVLQAWERLNLTTAVAAEADAEHAAFSPSSLSIVAARLVQEQLMAHRPTHVLIERQRFRTGGAASVFEWTLRVNSLEAMLHAIFAHMRTTGHWAGTVTSVLSQAAGAFLLSQHPEATPERGDGDVAAPKLLKPTEMKKFKTKLAAGMLTGGHIVRETNDAEDAVTAFLHRFDKPKRSSGTRRSKNGDQKEKQVPLADITKLDDLADCLMQAVAWLRWEANRELLVERGARALLDGADRGVEV